MQSTAVRSTRRARHPLRAALRLWRTPGVSLAVLATGCAAYLASRLLPLLPIHDDLTYGSGIGGGISRTLSLLTGMVPFSVAELFLFAYALHLVVRVPDALKAFIERRRTAGQLLWCGALRGARHV